MVGCTSGQHLNRWWTNWEVQRVSACAILDWNLQMNEDDADLVQLSAMIVSAYVAHNRIQTGELLDLIQSTKIALHTIGRPEAEPVAVALMPAVSVKKSITAEAIICLEDGKAFKTLKRHLNTKYGLTPDQYRAKWNLPADYPMVAPAYAERRSELARSLGLGRKPGASPNPTRKKAAVKG